MPPLFQPSPSRVHRLPVPIVPATSGGMMTSRTCPPPGGCRVSGPRGARCRRGDRFWQFCQTRYLAHVRELRESKLPRVTLIFGRRPPPTRELRGVARISGTWGAVTRWRFPRRSKEKPISPCYLVAGCSLHLDRLEHVTVAGCTKKPGPDCSGPGLLSSLSKVHTLAEIFAPLTVANRRRYCLARRRL